MVDPVTSFAVAGNVLQFVEIGVKLFRKSAEYAIGGGNAQYQSLHGLVEQLAVSNAHLQQSPDVEATRTIEPGPERALNLANKECLEVSKAFTIFLGQFKLNESQAYWSSFHGRYLANAKSEFRTVKLALKDLKSRSELELFQRRVEHARSNLILSLMVYLNHRTGTNKEAVDLQHASIIEEAQKTTISTVGLSDKIDALAKQVSDIDVSNQSATFVIEDTLKAQATLLKDVKSRLAKLLVQQNEDLTALTCQVQDLIPILEKDTQARQRILDTIYFPHMDIRRSQIVRAHPGTYQWILKPKEGDVIAWDDFVAWLGGSGRHDIYWVCGKAGSGKTTLMRELDARVADHKNTHEWAKGMKVLHASYYLWNVGVVDQKSFLGLLRGLAFQLFRLHPSCIDKVVETDRWDMAFSGALLKSWSHDELMTALQKAIECVNGELKIFLLIDGLNELEGTEDNREILLDFLRKLAGFDHVKICVSSRPWNIFRDSFRHSPQLHLEELTKDDISKYAHDKLEQSEGFRKLLRRDPQLISMVLQEIVQKARGVFLWVNLAIRDLLRVVRDGGRSRHVFRELEQIPPDLDDYFKHMMESIQLQYRKDAFMILQTALCNLDYCVQNHQEEDLFAGPDLLLMHLDYLDEDIDSCFAGRPSFMVLDFISDEAEMQDLLESLDRRLSSRCMGLLEVDQESRQKLRFRDYLWSAKIEFLHRTVRDFLLTPFAQNLMSKYIDRSFDAHLFRCNTLVAHVMSLGLGPRKEERFSVVPCFYRQLQSRPEGELASHLLFDKMTNVLANQRRDFTRWAGSKAVMTNKTVPIGVVSPHLSIGNDQHMKLLFRAFSNWTQNGSCSLSLAIELGWKSYVKSCLNTDTVAKKNGRPLLDYALRTFPGAGYEPSPTIVAQLLDLGADLESSWGVAPVWVHFLVSLQRLGTDDISRHMDIVRLVFRGRLHLQCAATEVFEATRESVLELRESLLELSTDISELTTDMDLGKVLKGVSERLGIDSLDSQEATSADEETCGIFDVFRSIRRWEMEDGHLISEHAVFTEAQISQLEQDLSAT